MDIYSSFVKQVDPRGHIMDVLIQHRVINDEVAEQLRSKETRQQRCRSMLRELRSGGNPRAFIVLRTALEKGYLHVVNMIDKPTTGTSGFPVSFTVSVSSHSPSLPPIKTRKSNSNTVLFV